MCAIFLLKVNVMWDHQFLHPIMPCEFLDSPEFESSRATTDEKFKVIKMKFKIKKVGTNQFVCTYTEEDRRKVIINYSVWQ